jgi:hypothetical protein
VAWVRPEALVARARPREDELEKEAVRQASMIAKTVKWAMGKEAVRIRLLAAPLNSNCVGH